MIHGFPDFWYSWRQQIQALAAAGYRVVAVDQRGYNLSDKPQGVESYSMTLLVDDIAAVVKPRKGRPRQSSSVTIGAARSHGMSRCANRRSCRLLVICNLPHPAGIAREIAINPQQKKNSEYAFNFQKPDAHKALTVEQLAQWVTDRNARRAMSKRSNVPISKRC